MMNWLCLLPTRCHFHVLSGSLPNKFSVPCGLGTFRQGGGGFPLDPLPPSPGPPPPPSPPPARGPGGPDEALTQPNPTPLKQVPGVRGRDLLEGEGGYGPNRSRAATERLGRTVKVVGGGYWRLEMRLGLGLG